jgi:hypothetical protein
MYASDDTMYLLWRNAETGKGCRIPNNRFRNSGLGFSARRSDCNDEEAYLDRGERRTGAVSSCRNDLRGWISASWPVQRAAYEWREKFRALFSRSPRSTFIRVCHVSVGKYRGKPWRRWRISPVMLRLVCSNCDYLFHLMQLLLEKFCGLQSLILLGLVLITLAHCCCSRWISFVLCQLCLCAW